MKFNKGILALDTENKIKVPNLVGKTEGEAKQILEESGLKCKVTARRESKKYDEGYVIEQNPEEGKRVKKGYDVEIVVSSGKKSEEGHNPGSIRTRMKHQIRKRWKMQDLPISNRKLCTVKKSRGLLSARIRQQELRLAKIQRLPCRSAKVLRKLRYRMWSVRQSQKPRARSQEQA